jgi:hypothetical protein
LPEKNNISQLGLFFKPGTSRSKEKETEWMTRSGYLPENAGIRVGDRIVFFIFPCFPFSFSGISLCLLARAHALAFPIPFFRFPLLVFLSTGCIILPFCVFFDIFFCFYHFKV